MKKKWCLGITGGIASGKTTVSQLFAQQGIDIIDADLIARSLVTPATETFQKIINHFGQHFQQPNGELDRAALRKIIFTQAKQRQWLEQLLHPLIEQTIYKQLHHTQTPYAALVSPLLIEAKQQHLINRLLVIDTPETLQITRAMQRDTNTEAEIKAIINTQLSRQARLQVADDIITNDQDINHLKKEVKQLHTHYLNLCQQ